MTAAKKKGAVVAICIQEPAEDGSSMDFGPIKGDDIRFLHQAFITDTISTAFTLPDVDVRLYHMNAAGRKRLVKIVSDYLKEKAEGKMAEAIESRFTQVEMGKGRWGVRIEKVFEECFSDGYDSVIVVGSRTPTITPVMLKTAFNLLSNSDAVFGPTPEGRYYIIGMRGKYHIKLSEFDWKSPSIYSQVADAFTSKELAWSELEIWYAVDTTNDLEIMVRDINQFRFDDDEKTSRETEKVMERILARLQP